MRNTNAQFRGSSCALAFGNWLLLPVFWFSIVGCACAQGFPTPPVLIPFDATGITSGIDQTIEIREKRSYHFDLNFYYSGQQDMPQVRQLAGDGTRFPDGRYYEPGATVPIHLRVVAQFDRKDGRVLYDKTVATQGHYSHGFLQSEGGFYARTIAGIVLEPGLYRVSANATEKNAALPGISTRFSITYDSRLAPIGN